MLNHLSIRNYAIVDHLDLDLSSGMTVITGETGAGKSIMLDALALALGGRGDREVIRAGTDKADITASFDIAGNGQAKQWLEERDLDSGEDECLLRRVINSEGRSRAWINGQQTTLNELTTFGELLIDIHSQHEHQSLLRNSTHQRLLDDYSKCTEQARKVKELASEWSALNQKIRTLSQQSDEDAAQVELLSYQVEELDKLGLQPGEAEALDEEQQRLSHASESMDKTRTILDMCDGDEQFNLLQGISQVSNLVNQLPVKDSHIEEAAALLENAQIQLDEAVNEIRRSLDKTELDPERLQQVDDRLGIIHQLARKHRVSAEALIELQQTLQDKLDAISSAGTSLEALEAERDALHGDYKKQADTLSSQRQTGAIKLEKAITDKLQQLGMPGASLKVDMKPTSADTPSGNGLEKCEFLINTNPGQPFKALNKIASGGELSRISLAIQVVAAQTSDIPSLVFDEVDVGIGGGIARVVGELLRMLGDKGQVICITHQPQVASQGHHHLYVSKASDGSSTATKITLLDEKARVEEVARMLAGDELTDKSLAHAKELMA